MKITVSLSDLKGYFPTRVVPASEVEALSPQNFEGYPLAEDMPFEIRALAREEYTHAGKGFVSHTAECKLKTPYGDVPFQAKGTTSTTQQEALLFGEFETVACPNGIKGVAGTITTILVV